MALYAFDGTGQDDESLFEENPDDTNVSRFRQAYRSAVPERTYYARGVGTVGFFRRLLGLITGAGGRRRVNDALAKLRENVAADDTEIDVVGYSRGAALALHFVNRIEAGAVTRPNGDILTVRFLGLWDTVAAFGIPSLPFNLGWRLDLPRNVQHCYHAMALDERRFRFRVRRPEVLGDPDNEAGRLVEVWFRGVHSDVGGGRTARSNDHAPDDGLSSIALIWMLGYADRRGVVFDADKVDRYRRARNPEASIGSNLDPVPNPYRDLSPADVVHDSVSFRADHHNPPAGTVLVADSGDPTGTFTHGSEHALA